jgi:hypothetical protein
MRCPKPHKERSYATRPPAHLDISAGVIKPYRYRSRTGDLAEHYRFKSRFGAWFSVTEHIPFNDKIEAFTGVEFAETMQGLEFRLSGGGNSISEEHYNGSLLIRVPVGITYWFMPGWNGSVAPMFVYNSHWSTSTSGSYIGSGSGSVITQQSQWREEDFTDKMYAALSLSTRVMIRKRLSVSLAWSIDFDTSAGTYSEIDNTTGGATRTYMAAVEPYLMYGSFALNYVLWKH